MTIKTSKGKEFEADIVLELAGEGSLLIQLKGDERQVSKIAANFEGLEWVMIEEGQTFTEYTDLRIVCRLDANTVQLRLFRNN